MAGRIILVTKLLVLLTIGILYLSHPPTVTAVVNRALDTKVNSLPVPWPELVRRVSTVADNYFPAQRIKDRMCPPGFAEVRRSAQENLNEKRVTIGKTFVTMNDPMKRGPVPDFRDFYPDAGQVTDMVLHNRAGVKRKGATARGRR